MRRCGLPAYHRLTIAGPQEEVAAFRAAAGGAGIIPWHLDLDRLEEDCFHLLVSPPAPQQRTLSLAGARIVAGQLRDAVGRRHDLAVARVGRSWACPLDLHALVAVPDPLLRLGPDDPASLPGCGSTGAPRRRCAMSPKTRPSAGRGGIGGRREM